MASAKAWRFAALLVLAAALALAHLAADHATIFATALLGSVDDLDDCGALDQPCCMHTSSACNDAGLACLSVRAQTIRCRPCGAQGMPACNGEERCTEAMGDESRACLPHTQPAPERRSLQHNKQTPRNPMLQQASNYARPLCIPTCSPLASHTPDSSAPARWPVRQRPGGRSYDALPHLPRSSRRRIAPFLSDGRCAGNGVPAFRRPQSRRSRVRGHPCQAQYLMGSCLVTGASRAQQANRRNPNQRWALTDVLACGLSARA